MATRGGILKDWQKQLIPRIEDYITKKETLGVLEKETAALNKDIKSEFISNNAEEIIVGDRRVYITQTESEEFNERQAIEILRSKLPEDVFSACVKTKEYIDDDALERLSYSQEIDLTMLDVCRTKKPIVYTLRIGKVKGGK